MSRFITLIVIFLCYTSLYAEYSRTCLVKYETTSGWSKTYEVVVHFHSGTELNKLTKSYNYSGNETYAVIWWSDESVTTITLEKNICLYSDECKYSHFNPEYYSSSEGEDQKGTNWKICWSSSCS